MHTRPVLGITMGDPAGIGPEIIVKALSEPHIYEICRPVVLADVGVMRRAINDIVKADMDVQIVRKTADGFLGVKGELGTMDVLPLEGLEGDLALDDIALGKVDARCGNAAFRSVETAIRLAMDGVIDGTVTAPLNKEAMNLAGHHYDGHTEIYATQTDSKRYCMMLADGDLRVAHVTTHMPLAKVGPSLTVERILDVIRLAHEALVRMGIASPRIGVAGLNPHAGENGLFGTEEQEVIAPAVERARTEGIDASGPFPPDTVFCKALGSGYDLVVAMYHDQGHIPMKLLSFKYDDATGKWSGLTGVNVTLGLPIIRASVDHGTAFENAGKNVAGHTSMKNAIEYAAMLASGRSAE
jgi:4-hydroxythreonine-4-phosphate dehydrogenase